MIFDIHLAILAVMLLAASLLAAEAGYRIGVRRADEADDATRAHVGALQNSLLGLLALLLGFTFSMAVSRYDARKELVLAESNAIGTAYLRARLQSAPQKDQLTARLREYVDLRLAFYAAGNDTARLKEVNQRTAAMHEQLWQITTTLTAQDTHSITAGLFVESLNDVIDLHEKRLRAFENHVPDAVLYLVFVVALAAIGFIGHGGGLIRRRYFISTALVSLMMTLVLITIVDLDRPRRGLIKVSQASMETLRDSLAPASREQ